MSESKLPSAEEGDYRGDLAPEQSWDLLKKDGNAMLIDVRTDAEFTYVGIPDISSLNRETKFVPWIFFPDNRLNPDFLSQCTAASHDQDSPILFLCRSGVRSRFAAAAATQAGFRHCYNILEGFEGDRNSSGHRNSIGGWRVAGLPWIQS
ncbi:MAG: rhodanese-like domain-containing protein [Gammaproteobacteria bacterium]|nr:rhodanese-like domain-containing protein [Gammaproteobacteria bacterium]